MHTFSKTVNKNKTVFLPSSPSLLKKQHEPSFKKCLADITGCVNVEKPPAMICVCTVKREKTHLSIYLLLKITACPCIGYESVLGPHTILAQI